MDECASERPAAYQNCFAVAIPLFLVATAVTVVQYKIPTIMMPLMEQFGIGSSTASWLMSVFTFMGIVFALPVGMMARRFGPRAVILAAVAIACVASAVGAFSDGVTLLLTTRAFEGLALVMIIACGPITIQLCVDPKRTGVASGVWMLGGMLGATIAGVITPAIYGAVGFSGLWLTDAAMMLAAGAVFFCVVRVPPHVRPAAEPGRPQSATGAFLGSYRVFLLPNTLLFFAPFAVFQVLLLSVLTYVPTFLQQQGMDASVSGFVSTLPMLLAIVSSIAFGALSDAFGRRKPLFLVGIVAMAACVPVMMTNTGVLLWVGVIAMGLLAMGVPTVAISAYPSILGDARLMTIGMGVLMLVQSVGQFLGSLVPSMLLGADLTNWSFCATILCIAGLLGAASVVACRFR